MFVTCCRCGATAEAMASPPLPTTTGKEVHERVCAACWQEWLRTQIMLINEYRLNLMDPEARRELEKQMRLFLQLPPAPAP